jgi:hypothetical protein
LAGPTAVEGRWFAWRLLGGNNRELGRSAFAFASVTVCRESASAARDGAVRPIVSLSADVAKAMWRWRLDAESGPIAVSSRLYLRQRECQYSLTQFLSGLSVAQLWGDPDDEQSRRIGDGGAGAQTVLPSLEIDLRDSDTASGTLAAIPQVEGGEEAHTPAESRSRFLASGRSVLSGLPQRPLNQSAEALPVLGGRTTRARLDAELARRRRQLAARPPAQSGPRAVAT